jgi:dipeptidyl-peptidase-4
MNRKLSFGVLIILTVLFSINLNAQNKKLTLEDIYTNSLYRSKGVGPLRWMKDNKSYSTLEFNTTAKGNDIVRYDVATGTKTILVNASQLLPAGLVKPLTIDNYIWSDDNSKLLIFTNTRKVWRQNSRGDYWVLNLATGKLKQLGKRLEEATLMFAKFSPDGGRVAYVSKLNIYAENIST